MVHPGVVEVGTPGAAAKEHDDPMLFVVRHHLLGARGWRHGRIHVGPGVRRKPVSPCLAHHRGLGAGGIVGVRTHTAEQDEDVVGLVVDEGVEHLPTVCRGASRWNGQRCPLLGGHVQFPHAAVRPHAQATPQHERMVEHRIVNRGGNASLRRNRRGIARRQALPGPCTGRGVEVPDSGPIGGIQTVRGASGQGGQCRGQRQGTGVRRVADDACGPAGGIDRPPDVFTIDAGTQRRVDDDRWSAARRRGTGLTHTDTTVSTGATKRPVEVVERVVLEVGVVGPVDLAEAIVSRAQRKGIDQSPFPSFGLVGPDVVVVQIRPIAAEQDDLPALGVPSHLGPHPWAWACRPSDAAAGLLSPCGRQLRGRAQQRRARQGHSPLRQQRTWLSLIPSTAGGQECRSNAGRDANSKRFVHHARMILRLGVALGLLHPLA